MYLSGFTRRSKTSWGSVVYAGKGTTERESEGQRESHQLTPAQVRERKPSRGALRSHGPRLGSRVLHGASRPAGQQGGFREGQPQAETRGPRRTCRHGPAAAPHLSPFIVARKRTAKGVLENAVHRRRSSRQNATFHRQAEMVARSDFFTHGQKGLRSPMK